MVHFSPQYLSLWPWWFTWIMQSWVLEASRNPGLSIPHCSGSSCKFECKPCHRVRAGQKLPCPWPWLGDPTLASLQRVGFSSAAPSPLGSISSCCVFRQESGHSGEDQGLLISSMIFSGSDPEMDLFKPPGGMVFSSVKWAMNCKELLWNELWISRSFNKDEA